MTLAMELAGHPCEKRSVRRIDNFRFAALADVHRLFMKYDTNQSNADNAAARLRQYLHMVIALVCILVAWFQISSGVFHFVLSVVKSTPQSDYAEWAMWEFMFGFGVASVATLFASREQFLALAWVRRTFQYSLIASIVLFGVPLLFATLSWLLDKWK